MIIMNEIELSKDLIEYIYIHCSEFKTSTEKLAGKTVLYNKENLTDKLKKVLIEKNWYSEDDKIQAMIIDGYESFQKKVALRILTEHKEELILNLCPNCNKLARTPLAKQCRFCFHSWRES
jgi:hypothetical protein